MEKPSATEPQHFQIKTLIPELLYVFILLLVLGIGFVALLFIDEKYHYLQTLGNIIGNAALNFSSE